MITTVARRGGPSWAGFLTLGLAGGAWMCLWLWDSSAWGRYLQHDAVADSGLAAPAATAVFVAGWVLMLAAMMLPTTRPLAVLFSRVVASRPDSGRLLGALVAGYLAVWVVVGLGAYGGDLAVHAVDDRYGLVGDRAWILAAGALAVAGGYQLSSLKERCLTGCRNPRLAIMARWHGRRPPAEAFSLGASHGWSCVGCCWALMLVMFGVGAGSLGWMLALAAVMTAEKTWRHGAALRVPTGVGLLGAALAVAVGSI